MRLVIILILVGVATVVGLWYAQGAPEQWATVLILGVTAGIAAWYANATCAMAEATRRSTETARQHIKLTCSPELLPDFAGLIHDADRAKMVLRVSNFGGGAARNVAVAPVWGEWDAEITRRGTGLLVPNQRQAFAGAFNQTHVTPVLPGGAWAELIAADVSERGGVLCLRWDDPVAEIRRWVCVHVHRATGGTQRALAHIEIPMGPVCDDCPERRPTDHKCPHELGLPYAKAQYEQPS